MQNLKCDWSISFIQVGRNRTHPIFQKLYHTNICTSSFYEFAILHSQTSWIIQVVSYKMFNVRPALEISQNSQEPCNFIKKETLVQVSPCEFYEFSKNTVFYRTPPVAASACSNCLIRLVWLTIGFPIFIAFTLSYKLFIPNLLKLFLNSIQTSIKCLSKMIQEQAAAVIIIALISEKSKSRKKRKKEKSLC